MKWNWESIFCKIRNKGYNWSILVVSVNYVCVSTLARSGWTIFNIPQSTEVSEISGEGR